MSDLKLDVDQAGEFKAALRREGWSNEDLKALCERKGLLAQVRRILHGYANVGNPDFFTEKTDDLEVCIPALPRPSLKEIQKKFPWITGVEFDESPTEQVTLKLGSILMGRETYIDGGEYAQRVATRQRVVLGFQQAMWLEEHQASFPQLMDLLDKIEIHFTGIVLIYSEKLTRVHLVRGGDGLLIRKNPENDRWVLRTTLLNFCHTTKGGGQNHGKNIAHCIALA